MSDKIHILLPVHNRREVSRRFIACLKKQTHQDYHLVLIDDGSHDGTADMVRENIATLTVITGTGAWWWAGCLQQGYLWMQGQALPPSTPILIINDDTEIDPDFLESGLALIRGRRRTLLLARCFSRHDGRLLDAGIHVDWRRWAHRQATDLEEINCLSTRGLFLHLGDFLDIGGFHPRLLPHYFSDYEFTIRAHRLGMSLITDPVLRLQVDERETGSRRISRGPFLDRFRDLFSKKSVLNPFYCTAYVMLACPWRWKALNLAKVLLESALNLCRVVLIRSCR